MSDIVIFEDMPNDAAFIEWLKNNQNGFVLNINKKGKVSPIYPKLHKASCSSFPIEKKTKIGQQKLQTISKFAQTQSKNLNNGAGSNTKKD